MHDGCIYIYMCVCTYIYIYICMYVCIEVQGMIHDIYENISNEREDGEH